MTGLAIWPDTAHYRDVWIASAVVRLIRAARLMHDRR
jgi:hypothetical protein